VNVSVVAAAATPETVIDKVDGAVVNEVSCGVAVNVRLPPVRGFVASAAGIDNVPLARPAVPFVAVDAPTAVPSPTTTPTFTATFPPKILDETSPIET